MVKCTAHPAFFAVRTDRNSQYSKRSYVCKKSPTPAVVFNFTRGQESKFRFLSTILPHFKKYELTAAIEEVLWLFHRLHLVKCGRRMPEELFRMVQQPSYRLLPCFNLFDFSWFQVTLVCAAENAPELTLWNTWVNFDLSGAAIHEIICPTAASSSERFLTKISEVIYWQVNV